MMKKTKMVFAIQLLVICLLTIHVLPIFGNSIDESNIAIEQQQNINQRMIGEEYSNRNESPWFIQTIAPAWDFRYTPSITLNSSDMPYISYQILAEFNDLTFFDGGLWRTINLPYSYGYPSIAIDLNDDIHISSLGWNDTDKYSYINYIFFDGEELYTDVVENISSPDMHTSIDVDSKNNPHICYINKSNDDLIYAYLSDNEWHIETIDSGDIADKSFSIVLDKNDHVHISYSNQSSRELKYAYFNGTEWLLETVDQDGGGGQPRSICTDSNNHPHIAYKGPDWDLKYAYYDGNIWNIELIDSVGDVGKAPSLVLDTYDRPHIVYQEFTIGGLKYAFYNGTAWNVRNINLEGIRPGTGFLALDSSNYLHISFHDTISEELKYATNNPSIEDITPPTLNWDNTPDNGTTGEFLHFNISTSDNVKVISVFVNWSHGNFGSNQSLTLTNGNWRGVITLDDRLDNLTYTIYINDTSNNYYVSSEKSVRVLDNDLPVLEDDNSYLIGTTGDEFIFNINATDNVGVGGVYINWSHNGLTGNLSLENVDIYWTGAVSLEHNLSDLIYTIFVYDLSGNYYVGNEKIVEVRDDDPPEIHMEHNTGPLTTGDPYTFKISVSDNIVLKAANVRYTFDGNTYYLKKMKSIGLNYTYNITIPDDATFINYSFNISDTSWNWNNDTKGNKTVLDNDPPQLIGYNTKVKPTVGENITLSFVITDNIGIRSASINYSINGLQRGIRILRYSIESATWNITISLPLNGSFLKYHITAMDVNDNILDTYDPQKEPIEIIDTIPPLANAGRNITIEQHEKVNFTADKCSDNIGITNWTWEFRYDQKNWVLYGSSPSFIFNESGSYKVYLKIYDKSGNEAEDWLSVSVNDIGDEPVDDDSDNRDSKSFFPLYGWLILGILIVIAIGIRFMVIHSKRKTDDDAIKNEQKQFEEGNEPSEVGKIEEIKE